VDVDVLSFYEKERGKLWGFYLPLIVLSTRGDSVLRDGTVMNTLVVLSVW